MNQPNDALSIYHIVPITNFRLLPYFKIYRISNENLFFFGSSSVLLLFVLSDSDGGKFSLLCTDGTQSPLSSYRSCNLGRGPGGGMVTRFNFRKVARKFLQTVQVLFLFLFSFLLFLLYPHISLCLVLFHLIKTFVLDCLLLFRCCLVNKGESDGASISSTPLLLENTTFSSKMWQINWLFFRMTWTSVRCWGWIMWLSSKALDMKVVSHISLCLLIVIMAVTLQPYWTCVCAGSSLEDSVVRWCCISHAEQKKCEQWALSIKSDPLVCVKAVSLRDCIEKIKVSRFKSREAGTLKFYQYKTNII